MTDLGGDATPLKECDPEYDELCRLFNLYRLANLNVRYYGRLGDKYERYAWWLDMATTMFSGAALFVVLLFESSSVRYVAAGLAGLSALGMSIAPVTGWPAKVKRYAALHAQYSQLFATIEAVITRIRREGLNDRTLGASELIHQAYGQMHAQDDLQVDQELRDEVDREVREAFPSDYVWQQL